MKQLENHMVLGDYYPEPSRPALDEDEAFERWRAENPEEWDRQLGSLPAQDATP